MWSSGAEFRVKWRCGVVNSPAVIRTVDSRSKNQALTSAPACAVTSNIISVFVNIYHVLLQDGDDNDDDDDISNM